MEEADSLADRIGIMDEGKVVALGSAIELKTTMLDTHTLIVKAWNINQNAIMEMQRRYAEVTTDGGTVYVTDKRLDLADVVARLHAAGVSIRGAYFKEPTLEDVFIRLTGKELRP
jgi:ABC-2 type transport system ATP-binding protein